jgi:hypothetical protein
MADWPAMTEWANDRLTQRFGTTEFLTDEVNAQGHKVSERERERERRY